MNIRNAENIACCCIFTYYIDNELSVFFVTSYTVFGQDFLCPCKQDVISEVGVTNSGCEKICTGNALNDHLALVQRTSCCRLDYCNAVCVLCVALPFLRQTRVLLYPMTVMLVVYIITVALHWNMTLKLCNFYYYRL